MPAWEHIEELRSSDTDVKKYIFKKEDAVAEAVLYKYGTYEERTVMCISTQTGCPMGCVFCGTGKFFGRNLTYSEIIHQVQYMADKNKIDMKGVDKLQIMVMSMGEPVLNTGALWPVFENLYKMYPTAQLLISTSAPKTKLGWADIMRMSRRIPTVGLQFSVHESTDEARNKIMPMKAKLSLEEISLKGLEFYQQTGRKPFFNYCVHEGNNSQEDAIRIRMLFSPRVWEATLSVICESDQTMADAVQEQEVLCNEFSSRLVELGYNTRVFNPAGQDDIGAGCGMLWETQKFVKDNPLKFKKSAGYLIRSRDVTQNG